MAPLQVILLLILVRLPRSVAEAEGHGARLPGFLHGPGLVHLPGGYVVGLFVACHVVLLWAVFRRTSAALKVLNHPSASSVAVAARTDSLFQHGRWATIVVTGVFVYLLGLPGIVEGGLARLGFAGGMPLVPEAIYMLPAVVCWVGFWVAGYRVEAANRERSLPYKLATGMPAHDMPALGQFLWMHARHNFYMIVPLGLLVLIQEIGTGLDPLIPHASDVTNAVTFICLVLFMPWFITIAWSTAPLKGILRAKLDGMARRYGLRFRNILIWKTHNAIPNAAILGYLPFGRYFLMTDALLETMTDRQLEGVFAHEVGHGVHRHLWWYLVFLATGLMLATGLAAVIDWSVPYAAAHFGGGEAVETVLGLGLTALFFGLGFPLVSHRFEHQADWFAAQHMAREAAEHPGGAGEMAALAVELAELPAGLSMSDGGGGVAIPGAALSQGMEGSAGGEGARLQARVAASPVGAEVFVSALDKVADLGHRSHDKKGWMHPSINRRIELVRKLSADGMERKAFERRMVRVRVVLAGMFLAAVGLTVWTGMRAAEQGTAGPGAGGHGAATQVGRR